MSRYAPLNLPLLTLIAMSFGATCLSTLAWSQDAVGHNIIAHASGRSLKMFMERDVSNSQLIQGNVLGSFSTGTAATTGTITVDLQPYPESMILDLHFTGHTTMNNNVAHQGPVTIYSRCNTVVDVRKPVMIDATGIHPRPAQAHCSSSIRIDEIDAKRRFVERIGWRRADRMHGQLEQAVSERAQVQSAQQLDQETDALLLEADRAFRERVREPMEARGAFPSRLQLSTSSTHLHFAGLVASASRLGPTNLPNVTLQDDLVVAFHESFLENFLEVLFGGKKVTDTQILYVMKLATGDAPRPLWIHARAPRWDATLAKQRPLTIKFDKGLVSATLAFAGASRNDERLEQPFRVSVVYRPDVTPDGPRILREGEVRIEFGDAGAVAEQRTNMQAFIAKKFVAMFQEEIYFDGFVAPAGGTWGKLRQFQMREFNPHQEWLVFAYRLKEAEPVVTTRASPAIHSR